MTLSVLDATGTKQTLSTTTNPSDNAQVGSTCVTDPASGAKQNVGTAHNGDNNALGVQSSALDSAVDLLFNGVGFDRQRSNLDFQNPILTLSNASQGTHDSADLTNYNHRGVQLGINVTGVGSNTQLVVSIYGKDYVSGQYYLMLNTVSIAANGFYRLTLYPGAQNIANQSISDALPRTFQIVASVTGVNGISGTIGASLIV